MGLRDTVDAHEFRTLTSSEEMLSDSHTLISDPNNPRVAIIRTSDRIAFKNCRRRWGWSSHLRHNLGPRSGISPLWFGSGIHFALEDFHGWNRFGHPKEAFIAYYKATKEWRPDKLPDDHADLYILGQDMLDYYVLWLQLRKNSIWKTYWHNDEPQVEVNFRFRIPGDWTHYGWDEVYYSGTIDRVCIDNDGFLWLADYKSAKAIQVLHYLIDPQVSAYMWAGPHIYDKPVGGFLYQQHLKSVPKRGRKLQNGSISVAQDQLTTHYYYRETLIDTYGSVERSPEKNQNFLRQLLREETETSDRFIRIDKIQRNANQAGAEGMKIMMELEDMLNPNLPLYPTPTRDCVSFCPFYSPCVSMDDGGDWKHELSQIMEPRDTVYDSWRKHVIWPDDPKYKQNEQKADKSWLDVETNTEDQTKGIE